MKIDWLTCAVWFGIAVAALALVGAALSALLWLAQRVAMALWPVVSARPGLLVLAVVALAAVAVMWADSEGRIL